MRDGRGDGSMCFPRGISLPDIRESVLQRAVKIVVKLSGIAKADSCRHCFGTHTDIFVQYKSSWGIKM